MTNVIQNVYKDLGYNAVALPKNSITPLMLLCKEGNYLSSLETSLDTLFEADMAPLPSFNTAVSNIAGQKKIKFDLDAGVSFLDGIFSQFNLKNSQLRLKGSTGHHYMVDFSFEDVKEDKVDLLNLDNYIKGAIPLKDEFPSFKDKLEKGDFYIVTSVLRSNKFRMDITDESDRQIDLGLEFQDTVNGSVNIQRSKNEGFTFSDNNVDLVFAFKAVQIFYDKAKWWQLWNEDEAKFTIKQKNDLVLRGVEEFPVQILLPGDLVISQL